MSKMIFEPILAICGSAATGFGMYIMNDPGHPAYDLGVSSAGSAGLMFLTFLFGALVGEFTRRCRLWMPPMYTPMGTAIGVGWLIHYVWWAPVLLIIPGTMFVLWCFGIDYRLKLKS